TWWRTSRLRTRTTKGRAGSRTALPRRLLVAVQEVSIDVVVAAAARGLERAAANELRDLTRRLAEQGRGAEDRQRRRQERDALDAVAAVQFGAEHRRFRFGDDVAGLDLRLHEIGADGGRAHRHDLRGAGVVILEHQPMLDRLEEARRQDRRLV